MTEFLFDIFLEFFLGIPGNIIIWACKGFRGSLGEAYKNNEKLSAFLGLIFWALVLVTGSYIAGSFQSTSP